MPGKIAPTLVLFPIFAITPLPLLSQTDSDTFQVSITVEGDCSISMNSFDFGVANNLASPISGSTTGTVICNDNIPVAISFDAGTGGSSTFVIRQLDDGSGNTIDYNLYRDAAYTQILGDGGSGTFTINLTASGGVDSFSVYGRIGPGQNPRPSGVYSSTVTATVSF